VEAVPDEPSISQRILDATEGVLRRHGVEKTNVVDVARSLGMSHGNIYRHFSSKQELINAVALRWLRAVTEPLDAIVRDRRRSAPKRLEAWFDTLRALKKRKVLDDPELFRVHHQSVMAVPEIVADHVATLLRQLETILADGIAAREFSSRLDPAAAARAFLQGTAAFHHPALLQQNPPPSDADARAVFQLLLAGLRGG